MTTECNKDYFQILPYEILEKIFSYLMSTKQNEIDDYAVDRSENTDIKRALLVSKLWNQVISNSIKLMSKIILQITDLSIDDLEYPAIVRRYQKISFFKVSEDYLENCFFIMKTYGHEIRELTFSGTYLNNYSMIMMFLRHCPNIETLSLYNTHIEERYKKRNIVAPTSFRKLKNLNIINKSQPILETFKRISLECLSVHCNSLLRFPSPHEWKIRKLDVGRIFDIASLIRFFKEQKPFIRELSFEFNSSVLEYVMSDMKNLIKLKLLINHVPNNMIYNFMESDENLKELTIEYRQHFIRTDFIQSLLRHYSNIEILNLEFYYGGWAFANDDFIIDDLKNLKHMSVNSSSNIVLQQGSFPSLKSLTVTNFRGYNIYNFPLISSLECLTIKYTTYKLSAFANYYPNLKFMSVENGVELTEKEMKKLVAKLPKLEILRIKKYMWIIRSNPKEFLLSLNNTTLNVIFQDN